MKHTTITRAEQIQNAIAQNDLELYRRLTIDSSSQIIRRAITGFYTKDPPVTSRPVQSESVYPSYEVYERGLPKVMGLKNLNILGKSQN